MKRGHNGESTTQAGIAGNDLTRRRDFFKLRIAVTCAVGVGFNPIGAAAQPAERASGPLDAASEAKKIAFTLPRLRLVCVGPDADSLAFASCAQKW
jgi:hypothetical protein